MKIAFGPLLTTILAYTVLGFSGLALAIPPGYASPVFPAAGLAVALALYFGNRILPGIWFGSLTINLIIAWQTSRFDTTSTVIAAMVASGAVLQTWAARWMILHWLGDNWCRLETEKDITLFLLAGAPLTCLIAATIGNCTLYVAGVIPAEEFFNSWWNWWAGDTLGILIFAPLTLIFLFRKESPWKERRLTVALPMLVTLCLVATAFLSASHRQQRQQIEQIEKHGTNIAKLLNQRFIAHQEALSALKRLVEVMPDMTFQQFEYFTQITLQDNKDIFALSINPYIIDSSRSTFEKTMTMAAMDSFIITERNSQKQLVPAPKRLFYIPVGFIAPIEGNRPAIGFNIHSEPIRRDAIEMAISLKRPTVTAPIQLVQEAQKRVGVLSLTPAYHRENTTIGDGNEKLMSFVVGVFKIDEMVQIATQNRVPAGMIFRLTDHLADADRRLLFQSDEGRNRPVEPYVWRTQLTMADRQWNIEVFPTEAYLHQQSSSFGWVVAIAGLLFATLLQIMLLAMTGRTSVIQKKVNVQTVQLMESFAEAKRREEIIAEKIEELELVLEGVQLGTWNWDIVSDHFEFNERFFTMLGYKSDELKQHVNTLKELLHPDDKDYLFSVLEAHLAGTTTFYRVEHRLRHKSGKWIWILATGKVFKRDQQGGALHALGIHLDITEQKEAQYQINKAKEESDAIIRNFLDTLIVVHNDLTVARINQATCQLLGYTEKELIGEPITLLFHEPAEQVNLIFSFYKKGQSDVFNNTTELRNIELCYRAKDGSRLPMSINVSLLKDDNGLVTGVVAGAKDISKLQEAINRIARQKEYIEKLFDVLPEGLLALAPSMEIIGRNRAFNTITRNWSTLFNLTGQEIVKEIQEKITKSLNNNKQSTFSLNHNNNTAYLKYNATPVPELEEIEYVVSLSDITSERKTEAERRLLATVIEQTADSVIITETDGTILYVNQATTIHTGFSESELHGKKTNIFKSGLTNPAVYKELWGSITKGNNWSGLLSNHKKDGTIIEENVTISPVRDEDGNLTHFVAIKRDMTEMILLHQQLLQAQKLEAIGQLAAGIAHEINTPIQYVQNNVSFIERAFGDLHLLLNDYLQLQNVPEFSLTAEARHHLDDINLDFLMEEIPESIEEAKDGINRVVKIISAMKDFSHPGTGKKVATDLNRALDSTITVARNEWKYVAEMVTDFDPDLPMVSCLPDQLNQVMLNLIINSAHAIEETGASASDNAGRITISTRQDNNWIEIRISDTGAGIPDEIRNQIFDPFFTTKIVGKGTGQGLAIAHDVVVSKHGGTINLTTEPGKGTTFIIRLPLTSIKNEITT